MSLYYLLNPKFFSPTGGGIGDYPSNRGAKKERLDEIIEPESPTPKSKKRDIKRMLLKLLEVLDD